MYWNEGEAQATEYPVPKDVFDLLFRLRGTSLDIDHAGALARALRELLPSPVCERIGVHGVRLAVSGNGWQRPQQPDAELPLSRRARLVIRLHEEDLDEVMRISRRRLRLGAQEIEVGEGSIRPLSVSAALHARAVAADPAESEARFLERVAGELKAMRIEVGKMICGRAGRIRDNGDSLFTRALLVADLGADESIRLQRNGVGEGRLMGCGLFVPHKGIDPVYSAQE